MNDVFLLTLSCIILLSVIGLAYGFVVAFASGIAVVVAITMGGVNAIVGTAISASLLPPVVNSGICLSLATIYWFMGWGSDARSYAQYSVVSFIYLLVVIKIRILSALI